MSDFSFCIITKNEEKNIARCLEPLQKTGQEIIVLDTGSTDSTVSIAEKYTAHIYFFEWINDFSAARNYAMSKASNDFVLFLDSDEYTEDIDVAGIKKLICEYPEAIGRIIRRNQCPASGTDNPSKIMVDRVERLFDRRLYTYTGKIHEQVTHRQGKKLYAYELPLTVLHDGYVGTLEERRKKADRNNALLFEELKSSPEDPYLYYQLGQSYGLCEDAEQEYTYYHKGCSLPLDLSLEYVKIMIVSYGYAMLATGRQKQAMELIRYYDRLSSYADYICMLGCVYLDNHQLLKAIRTFRHALTLTEYHVEGSNNACPWHNLGCIYDALGNEEDALFCYQEALRYHSSATKPRYNALLIRMTEQKTSDSFSEKYLSVFIPCHNAADCLDEFLEELEEQTMGLSHTELIFLIPDSKDNTWNRLNQFEQKYPDSVILIPITPESEDCCPETICECISSGLAADLLSAYSTAPYLCFMEPADRFHMDLLRQYHQASLSEAPDMITCITDTGLPVGTDLQEFTSHISDDTTYSLLEITDDKARGQLIASSLFNGSIRGRLFSRTFLEEQGILAPMTEMTVSDNKQTEQLLKARICLSVQRIFYISELQYLSIQ